ncbi:MAG: DUF134 domain-containing protein [Proteobacteria bacterium]|nr:DUF134 domain-containing protein [Alphaproteobacteria bacterium]NCC04162.1 DUF134 domain-containing protein [Pseudomonadota bacterium]
MVRPRKCRRIGHCPPARFYKPQGIPLRQMGMIQLPEDGLEALRLADVGNMDHETAAAQMGVSRPTFSRILAQARKAVATALCEGAALRIGGEDAFSRQEQ